MNKLKKIVKKFKKVSDKQEDVVLYMEEKEEGYNVIINGENGVEDSFEIDKEMKSKLVELLDRNNMEYFESQSA